MGLVDDRRQLVSAPTLPVGPESREALVRVTDAWLAELFERAGGAERGAALVAVGGLGRRELTPGSDLDLLLLHPPGVDVADLADAIWYPIWDAGVALDHSVRTVSEARRLASSDLRVVLGLLDARTVVGDDSLTAGLRGSVLGDWRSMAKQRLPELREAVDLRRERFGDLAHLLEPHLKDSFGGLRDIVVLRAVSASWFADIPHASLAAPHEALLDVRDAMHRVSGRAVDRLSAQDRPSVAAELGLPDGDALLRAVCGAGRSVAYAADLTWARLDRLSRSRGVVRRVMGRRAPGRTPLAEGVVAQDGEAVLALDARPDRDPALLLRAAAAAAQAGMQLAPHAVDRLAADCPPMPEPWPQEARDSLVSLLGAGRSALPVWEALDQAGVWARLIPEWEVLRSAPQHNPVHVFTVDRHLVETAIRASGLTRRVRRPDLLLVGSLLHDVGKARGGDHTQIGVALVAELAPRLGFDTGDSEVLVDLVRHHLLLPEVATRRDLDDPATAEHVARLVPDPDTLDLLASLTEADSLATGPGIWSEWKATLVSRLVGQVKARLGAPTGAAAEPLSPSQLARVGTGGLSVEMERNGPATEVTVASPDSVGLLAATAGVLALHRLGVRSARTQTVGDRVVAVWTVVPEYGDVPALDRLRDDLRRALEGSLDVSAALARRERDQRRAPTPPPTATVVPGASEVATVLEVRAHDSPGLLHRVAAAISWAGVDITAALVATLGSEVVDAFYLRSAAGGPLDDREIAAVRAAVLAALEGEVAQ